MFVAYLRLINHPKANMISELTPERPLLKWCTKSNKEDSVVFLMRHMEMFNGEDIESWDCGFKKKPNLQKNQLNLLRKRYATKLLLSDDNIQKKVVIDATNDFDELDEKEKVKVENLAKKIANDRQSAFH